MNKTPTEKIKLLLLTVLFSRAYTYHISISSTYLPTYLPTYPCSWHIVFLSKSNVFTQTNYWTQCFRLHHPILTTFFRHTPLPTYFYTQHFLFPGLNFSPALLPKASKASKLSLLSLGQRNKLSTDKKKKWKKRWRKVTTGLCKQDFSSFHASTINVRVDRKYL